VGSAVEAVDYVLLLALPWHPVESDASWFFKLASGSHFNL
jgi:hypothetical protein